MNTSSSHEANVLVIGSINMDIVTPVHRMPRPGETIAAGATRFIPGGKGANAAVAAARIGSRVRMIGALGEDAFGHTLRNQLEHEGIDTTRIASLSDIASGTAIILLDEHSGQNSILISAGANAHVTPPDSASADVYKWARVMMLQLETPLACNVKAAGDAKAAGVLVMLDPAPAKADLPDELVAACDVMLPNETELAILTGQPVETLEEIAAAARKLVSRGCAHVIVTLGGRGAMHVTRDQAKHHTAETIKPVDTTAAGDAFAGALASELASGGEIENAIPIALAAGSLACMTLGAQPSLPTKQAVMAFITQADV